MQFSTDFAKFYDLAFCLNDYCFDIYYLIYIQYHLHYSLRSVAKKIKHILYNELSGWHVQILIFGHYSVCRFSAVFIYCQLKGRIIPRYVSLVKDDCELPSNTLRVLSIETTGRLDDFGVCISPLFKYNDHIRAMEVIEVDKLFGASQFVFYNHSMGSNVSKVLNRYTKQGTVQLLQWPIKAVYSSGVHYKGQMAALNDCLYRLYSKVKYIVVHDMDETIVPRKHRTWSEMINYIKQKYNESDKFGAFDLKSYFFWDANEKKDKNEIKLMTLQATQRTRQPMVCHKRSKYIVEPRKVQTTGIHFVWKYNMGFGELCVPIELGDVHHYRKYIIKEYSRENGIKDDNMHRFESDLKKIFKENNIKVLK